MPTFQPSSHSYGGISHADDSYGFFLVPALTRHFRTVHWKCDHYKEKKQKALNKAADAKAERDAEYRKKGMKGPLDNPTSKRTSKWKRKEKERGKFQAEANGYDSQISHWCSKSQQKQSETELKESETELRQAEIDQALAPAPVDSAGASLPPVVEEGGLPGWVLPVAGIGVLAVVGIGAALALRR